MKCILLFIVIILSNYSFAQENWWMQVSNDSIATTDVNKALLKVSLYNKKVKPIIIAVLDSDFDLEHPSFKDILWQNSDEIPENGIDDDKNGYIDDTTGWNFIGKKVDRHTLTYTFTENTRILRKLDSSKINKLHRKGIYPFSYTDVKTSYDNGLKSTEEEYTKYWQINWVYEEYLPQLKKLLPDSTQIITSELLKNITIKDSTLNVYRNYMVLLYDTGFSPEVIKDKENLYENLYNICYNLSDEDNRVLIGDDPENIKDRYYGSNLFGTSTDVLVHGTKMAGVIARMIGSDSTSVLRKTIKIMPITINGYGNYLDKDLAIGIRYAVDNGAQVINISQTKGFSKNPKFISKALKYAEKHDVLIINSAGNNGKNLDEHFLPYPNDSNNMVKEQVTNFMVTGASNKSMKNLIWKDSDYGKKTVDLFAPGENINTLIPNNKTTVGSGTSYAAIITSGIAALIRSHYPSLTAPEVKQILMDSAVKYDTLVNLPTKEDPDNKVPFSSLSKFGGIVNAYNALLLAEKIVNEK